MYLQVEQRARAYVVRQTDHAHCLMFNVYQMLEQWLNAVVNDCDPAFAREEGKI
ncbi:unnamed protein product, partial [Nesidiocoris tenuis]